MKEVTQDEFYKFIGHRDVVTSVIGRSPFTVDFKLRHGSLIGRTIDSLGVLPEDDYTITKYFIVQ